jgi:hypothetical protein
VLGDPVRLGLSPFGEWRVSPFGEWRCEAEKPVRRVAHGCTYTNRS